MSLPADGQTANYILSLWTFLETNFQAVPKYFIGYNELDTKPLTEWAEFILGSFGGRFLRQVGMKRNPTLIANFYLRQGYGSDLDNGMRWLILHDQLNAVLGNTQIPVYDHVGGRGSLRISSINVQGWLTPTPLGMQNDLFICSDQVDLDFTESMYCE